MRVDLLISFIFGNLAVSCWSLTFSDAMNMAIKGEIDSDLVLATFLREQLEAEHEGNAHRIRSIKANLGALLLNLANKTPDPASYRAMYKYCEDVSKELIALDVSFVLRILILGCSRTNAGCVLTTDRFLSARKCSRYGESNESSEQRENSRS